MKPQHREKPVRDPRRLSCEILDRIEHGGSLASQELARLGDQLGDERDLRLATELVYGTLRHRAELDYYLEQLSGRLRERIDAALLSPLRIGLYQILYLDRVPPSAAVNESVSLARQTGGARGSGFVNAVLRAACRRRAELHLPPEGRDPVASLALTHSIPAWMVSRWWGRLGDEETRSLTRSLSRPAPLALWVNPLKTDSSTLASALAGEGVLTEPSSLLPGALRVTRGQPQRTKSFLEGHCYAQDEASQAISLLLGARPGETLVDLCTAPGGKAFGLASQVGVEGRILALDRDLARMYTLLINRKRLGLSSVLPIVADLMHPPPLAGKVSGVLLDAPCTGTGILRRHPEIGWRRTPMDLTALTLRQSALLEAAASLLAPGGRMVYSVCSLEPEEGEERISDFLSLHADFGLENPRDRLPSPLADAVTPEGYFRTWPHRHDADGFFAALLRRLKGPGGRVVP